MVFQLYHILHNLVLQYIIQSTIHQNIYKYNFENLLNVMVTYTLIIYY